MSSDPDTFSMSVTDAEDLNKECYSQLSILEDLISYEIENQEENINRTIFSLLCEGYHINHKIVMITNLLKKEAQRIGEAHEEELLIGAKEMLVLQTSVMARYYVSTDLVNISGISTANH